jgi:hypothetical protein
VSNPVQSFRWNGSGIILRFDVDVDENITARNLILKFDIAVEGLPIVALRPEIAISREKPSDLGTSKYSVVETASPKTAFASYASADRKEVLGRVRSLQLCTGIDVFLDCLSLRPGEEWKSRLNTEINNRDVFWLFWSRHAMESQWVDWEWRTALTLKTLSGIQPHPLEPTEAAPPPKELSELQFGSMYEWYVTKLREPFLVRHLRRLSHKIRSLFRKHA